MQILYKNNQIEKLCKSSDEMKRFFNHDNVLVEGLQTLMDIFDLIENVNELYNDCYRNYNFEPIIGDKNGTYSIRIIPKKRKYKHRMHLIPKDNGICIEVLRIDDKHTYRT